MAGMETLRPLRVEAVVVVVLGERLETGGWAVMGVVFSPALAGVARV